MKQETTNFKRFDLFGVRAARLVLSFVLIVGTAGCSGISGDVALDKILRSVESSDRGGGNFIHTLASLDRATEDKARGCIDITYSSGGKTRVCGPNTDTIAANCSRRGWSCKKVNAGRLLSVMALTTVPQFDLWREIEIKTVFEGDDTARLRLRAEATDSEEFECTFAFGTMGEDFCAATTLAEGCSGCESSEEGGIGVVTCTDCCQCSQAATAPGDPYPYD